MFHPLTLLAVSRGMRNTSQTDTCVERTAHIGYISNLSNFLILF